VDLRLTEDQLRWAEALAIERQHGVDAPRWLAERIRELALAGDEAGITRFKAIAARLDRLTSGRAAQ
jgi:RecB family exonuclease